MNKILVCPWRIHEIKTTKQDGLTRIEETHHEFESCCGSACPFFQFNNPSAGYPSKCGRNDKD